jgi:predicted metal-binding protein
MSACEAEICLVQVHVFIIHMYAHSQAGWVWWIKLPEKYRQNFNILNKGPLLETLNFCLYFSGI